MKKRGDRDTANRKGENDMRHTKTKNQWKHSRCLLAAVGAGMVLSVCGQGNLKTDSDVLTPTGYSSDEVQRKTVYYNGTLYWYQADGFDKPLEKGFELVGEVEETFVDEYPSKEFGGTRVEIGQEIYADPSETSRVYIKYENGYARFEEE